MYIVTNHKQQRTNTLAVDINTEVCELSLKKLLYVRLHLRREEVISITKINYELANSNP